MFLPWSVWGVAEASDRPTPEWALDPTWPTLFVTKITRFTKTTMKLLYSDYINSNKQTSLYCVPTLECITLLISGLNLVRWRSPFFAVLLQILNVFFNYLVALHVVSWKCSQWAISFRHINKAYKQLLDEVFAILGIIKVEIGVISQSR